MHPLPPSIHPVFVGMESARRRTVDRGFVESAAAADEARDGVWLQG